MPVTSTNRTDISYIEEVTAGTTPATPTMQLLPTTGGAPMSNITNEISQVIRSDRMTDDLVLTDLDVEGEMNYELSYAPYVPLIKAALRGTTVTVAVSAATDIAVVTGSPDTLTSTTTNFITEGIVVGMTIKVSGFTEAANNTLYYVSSVSANSLEVETSTTLVNEVAGDSIDIESDFTPNGESNLKTYTFLKRVLGITNPAYFYYRGCEINEISMNFETGAILAGNMSIMGLTEEITETEIAGSTYNNPPSYSLMNSTSSVTNINLGGLTGTSTFSTLNLMINNNINAAKGIGTLGAVDLAAFTLDVMGEVTLYFESKSLYDFYKASNSFTARFALQDGDGNQIVMALPKCKFENLETPIDGRDNFFMANGTLRGLRDATANHMISMSVFPAP